MTDDRREPTFSPYGSSPSGPDREQPRRGGGSAAPIAVSVLVLALAAGGWFWWSRFASPGTQASEPAPAATVAQPAEAASAPQPPALLPAASEDVVKADEITAALTKLVGRESVLKFLQTTDFPRRFVATLDSLGREHAPLTVWPVQPTPGRFAVEGKGASTVISAENALRYAPFVAFVGSVDSAKAVDLYRRMYPALEQANRDLGFAKRPLHARVFEVIDLLLATPEPAQPPKLTLTEVKGPVPSTRPWTRYEYEDARFQHLPAGQKMLLRMGPENRKVLKAKLQELRQELLRVSATPSRP